MSFRLEVQSARIGGNPGGRCGVHTSKEQFEGYFKFCYGSRIGGASSLRTSRQPVYEAITFQLVRSFGLGTTDFYVLLNQRRDVQFDNWRKFSDHNPSGRDLYFLSKLLPPESNQWHGIVPLFLSNDMVYLESLRVGDIIGRRQNYYCYGSSNTTGNIVYIDLGCSFVYAKDGYLTLPHKVFVYEAKEFKRVMHRLERASVITRTQRELNLATIVEELPHMTLPTLNAALSLPVEVFLEHDEIKEIQGYVAQGLEQSLQAFRQQGLLKSL